MALNIRNAEAETLASELAKQTAERATKQQDTVLADAQQIGVAKLSQLEPLQVGPHPDGPDAP